MLATWGEIEEVRNASNSPNDDGTSRRHRDLHADGLPSVIDIRVLQAGKLWDGRLLVFAQLKRARANRGGAICDRTYGRMTAAKTLSMAKGKVIDMRLFVLLSVLLLTACMTAPSGEAPPAPPAAPTSGGGGY